jgi:hypothetical protein
MKTFPLIIVATLIGFLGFGQFPGEKSITGVLLSESQTQNIAGIQKPSTSLFTWSGLTSTEWNQPGNWTGNVVPSPADDVLIPAGCLHYPVIDAGQFCQCNNLDISGTGTKSALSGWGMIINGEMSVNGTLNISTTGSIDIKAHGALTVVIDINIEGNFLIENAGSLINEGEISGVATIQRTITPDMSWHLLSSPVNGQAICNNVFAPKFPGSFPGNTSTWDFYSWLSNCPTPPDPLNWRNLRRPNGTANTVDFPGLAFLVTKGYLVAYGSGWSSTKTFIGTPTNCTQVCGFFDVIDPCSWALPGNPFPSAIDWRRIPDKSNLVNGYYYVWNEHKSGGAGYEYWKDDSHYSSRMVDGYIPPMQGFFVLVDPAGGLELTLPNEARVHHNTTDTWLKDDAANRLTLTLSNGTNWDDAIIMFENNSTAGQDRSDAEKLFSMSTSIPQVYSIIDNNMKAGLNSLPPASNITVPVGFVAPADGNYSLKATGTETFGLLTGLVLEDLNTGISQDLIQNPVYSFSSLEKEDAGRFLLHFSGTIGVNNKEMNPVIIYSHGNTVCIKSGGALKNSTVTVCDLLGREVLTKPLGDQAVTNFRVDAPGGYYIVRVQGESVVKTEKILIREQ